MKVLIVEDEELVRELLLTVAEREFDFSLVEGASNGIRALKLFSEVKFDFIVLDLLLPQMDGLTVARQVLSENPDTRILAISSECDDYTVREVNEAGILGFVDKGELSVEMLIDAFEKVSTGHVFYSSNVYRHILKMTDDPQVYYKLLSQRELQVVRAIANGQDRDSIAEELEISAFTVRRHKHNAMQKLNIGDEASLTRFALETGMIKNKGGLNWTDLPETSELP